MIALHHGYWTWTLDTILVLRSRAPFGQHQESRPLALARSNNGSPRFTDFTLRMLRVKSDKSDWFWSQSVVFTNPFKTETGMSLDLTRRPEVAILGADQNSAVSGDENVRFIAAYSCR